MGATQMRRISTRILDSRLGTEWPMPGYATAGAAAIDLRAMSVDEQRVNPDECVVRPGERCLVNTGIAIHISDPNLVGVVASRSGLVLKHGIRVAQGIGVIDSDYTGEIGVILQHDGHDLYTIQPGERIAQLMFQAVERVALDPVEEFSSATTRGAGGFGHTGR